MQSKKDAKKLIYESFLLFREVLKRPLAAPEKSYFLALNVLFLFYIT